MTAAIKTTAKAIAFGAEAVVDFFMISKFAAPVFVVGVMAVFASPVIIGHFFFS